MIEHMFCLVKGPAAGRLARGQRRSHPGMGRKSPLPAATESADPASTSAHEAQLVQPRRRQPPDRIPGRARPAPHPDPPAGRDRGPGGQPALNHTPSWPGGSGEWRQPASRSRGRPAADPVSGSGGQGPPSCWGATAVSSYSGPAAPLQIRGAHHAGVWQDHSCRCCAGRPARSDARPGDTIGACQSSRYRGRSRPDGRSRRWCRPPRARLGAGSLRRPPTQLDPSPPARRPVARSLSPVHQIL